MTKQHMDHLLSTRAGIGVETTTNSGNTVYYFYEDFDGPATGIKRAMKQLYPMMNKGKISGIAFIENAARKEA